MSFVKISILKVFVIFCSTSGEDGFESDLMTEALAQSQITLSEYLVSLLSSTVDLLTLYVNGNHMFSIVVTLHIVIFRLWELDNFTQRWDTKNSVDKKLVS